MPFTSGNDTTFVTPTEAAQLNAGAGDDVYVISPALVGEGQQVIITDAQGINTLQLINGLSITSSEVANNAVKLTLSNGAVVTLLEAASFTFEIGGDPLQGVEGTSKDFATFAQEDLGVTVPAAGEAPATGGEAVVGEGPIGTATIAVTADVANVDEGGAVNFTIQAAAGEDALAEGTEVAYTLSGVDAADIDTALTGTAVIGADGTATVTVNLLADQATEGEETLTLRLDGTTASADVVVNDTSLATSFELTAAADSINEGEANTFTVTASQPVAEDTQVTFLLSVEQDGDTASLADFNAGAFNEVTVTIPAGETTATFDVESIAADGTEASEKYTVLATVNGETLSKQVTILDGAIGAGQTFNLTTGVDVLPGLIGSNGNAVTSGNDIIIGAIDGANDTLNSTDLIDAGEGTDTLKVIAGDDITAADLPSFSNVEILEARSGGIAIVDLDMSTQTDLEQLNISATGTGAATLTAADTTDVNVAGAKADVTVNNGQNVTVTDATADTAITVDGAAGTISVTDSKQGTGDIAVDGGTDVSVDTTVSVTTAAVAGGDVTVGATTQASGTSTVVQNLVSNGGSDDAHDLTAADIAVTGGSSIDITVNATSTAKDENADGDIAIGAITATADDNTTTVSVVQNATATTFTKEAVADVAETSVVTFKALKANETLIINGLTFTADKDLTAEQTAQAFANLTAADTQTETGPVANGVYTDAFDSAVWTSGAANGATVTFTAQDADEGDLTFGGTAANVPTQVKTAGTLGTTAVTSTNAVTYGKVTINDNATASVTEITVDGYAATSAIGAPTATTTLLDTLTLANAGAGVDMTVADTADTLALSLENLGSGTGIDGEEAVLAFTAAPTTLNVTSNGNNYVDLTAAATETLNVSGTGLLDIADVQLTGLKTATVSGSAGLILNADDAVLTSVDTTATTGYVSATIDGTVATYTGGAGIDAVVLTTGTALTKAIDLGAGDDALTFDAAITVTGSTAALNGGEGTDTLGMSVANAAALDATAQTFYTGFERLSLNTVFGGTTANDSVADEAIIDLANLGFTNYVSTLGTDTGADATQDVLTLDKLANNGMVVLRANGLVNVNITDAATGTADVLNLGVYNSGAVDFGTLTANDVETFNIEAYGNGNSNQLNASGDKVASIVVTGESLTLTTDSAVLTSVDASALTGGLTYTADSAAATTVLGGAGADALTAAGNNDVLNGGAGNDTLTGANLTQLTGGEGNDTFVMNKPSNVNTYSTITDLSAGDVILLDDAATPAGTVVFSSSAVELAATAVFQDYANEAVNLLGADEDDAAWFQFEGNTYIVQSGNNVSGNDFVNGEDAIIQITGLVDLSTASYNQTNGTLEIA